MFHNAVCSCYKNRSHGSRPHFISINMLGASQCTAGKSVIIDSNSNGIRSKSNGFAACLYCSNTIMPATVNVMPHPSMCVAALFMHAHACGLGNQCQTRCVATHYSNHATTLIARIPFKEALVVKFHQCSQMLQVKAARS